jgi:hypothetical protein
MRPLARGLGGDFDILEARTLPTIFGIPWADPSHLTVSFAPDGTATPTGPSGLFALLNQTGPAEVWQREVLRAFQTWAVNANINIGLVADGGQALGTPGAVQGDSRFGDIRVAAAPLDPALVASASPFSWTGSTLSGDVRFNNSQPFQLGNGSAGFDAFSVALHEAGHAFGLDHGAADTVMNAAYVFSTAPSADEIAALQAMYGVRTPDAFEGRLGNDTAGRASTLAGQPLNGGKRFTADGDLTTSGDADFYKFNASAGDTTVRLQANGLSLLVGRVTVYDSAGRVVASGAASDILDNDVTLTLPGTKAGSSYTVKVERATDGVFGIGAYRLVVDSGTAGTTPPPPGGWVAPVTDGHTNDTPGRATALASAAARNWDARFDVVYRGAIEDAADVDFYRLSAPTVTNGASLDLNALVWSQDGNLNPQVRVFDATGQPVPFEVMANEAGVMSVWVRNAAPGGQYVLRVAAGNPGGANGTGAYVLGLDFNTNPPPERTDVGNGTLGSAATTATDTFTAGAAGIYQFALGATALAPGAGGVTLTVTDAAGQAVFTLAAAAGDPAVTISQSLAAGSYTLRYTYWSPDGAAAAPISYSLADLKLDEGVGTYATKTTTTTTTTYSTTTYSTSTTTSTGYWYLF